MCIASLSFQIIIHIFILFSFFLFIPSFAHLSFFPPYIHILFSFHTQDKSALLSLQIILHVYFIFIHSFYTFLCYRSFFPPYIRTLLFHTPQHTPLHTYYVHSPIIFTNNFFIFILFSFFLFIPYFAHLSFFPPYIHILFSFHTQDKSALLSLQIILHVYFIFILSFYTFLCSSFFLSSLHPYTLLFSHTRQVCPIISPNHSSCLFYFHSFFLYLPLLIFLSFLLASIHSSLFTHKTSLPYYLSKPYFMLFYFHSSFFLYTFLCSSFFLSSLHLYTLLFSHTRRVYPIISQNHSSCSLRLWWP